MSDPIAVQPDAGAGLDTIPFAVLVDEAWKSSRRHARGILLPAMVALAPAALLMQVGVGLWNLQLMDPGATADMGAMCGVLAIGGALMLLIGLWYVGVYGAMMVATTEALASGRTPAFSACARAFVRPRMWGTDLLGLLLTGLGLLACIVPGLLLLAAWALRIPVMVREGKFGFAALSRSWELLGHNPSRQLVRHPLLKVALLFLLGMLLGYAVAFVVQFPAIVVTQVLMFRELAQGEAGDPAASMRATMWLTIPSGVLAAMAQLCVQLYVDFAMAHLYFDQSRRKEGADLAAGLDRLIGPVTSPAPGESPAS